MGTITAIARQSVILDSLNPFDRRTGSTVTLSGHADTQPVVLFRFNMPSELKWRKILNSNVYLYINAPTQGNINIYTGSLTRETNFDTARFADLSTVEQRHFKSSTWANGGNYATALLSVPGYSAQSKWMPVVDVPSVTSEFLRFGLGAFAMAVSPEANIDTAEGAHPPYIVVEYADNIIGITPTGVSPTSGNIRDDASTTFTWGYSFDDEISDEAGYLAASTFALEWKQTTTTHTVAATSSGCTVPANTFPASGAFQIRVKVTNPAGGITYSEWYTLQSYKNITFTSASINPSSGFIQEKSSKTFTFSYGRSATDFEELFLSKSTFALEWKTDSSATATVTGNRSSVTVPANTFPQTGTFQARAKLTNPNGTTTYSEWNTYSTDEPPITATAVAPNNTVESDARNVDFGWSWSSPAGSTPTEAVMQWSTNSATWQHLDTVEIVSDKHRGQSIPLIGVPAGTIYWRIAFRNSDGVLGSYSAPASFVYIAAPAPPAVSVNPWPRARIQWQSAEQQAYRITVDGVEEIMAFGKDTQYTLLEALPDGEHIVTVSVQGQFGLWSAPTAVTFTVQNIETPEVILTGKSGIDNVLVWDDTDSYAFSRRYDIYRDGELIAIVKTMGNAQGARYVDKYANGKHTYKVRRGEAYYTDSNEITLYGGSCETVIGALDGEEYIPLTLTDTSDTAQTFSWRKPSVARHFEGAEYPVVETSDFSDRYANYTVAFTGRKCAEAFEALRGKTVIIKSRAREMMVGVLTEFEKRVGNFYITYTFSIRQIHTPKIDDRR